MKYLGVSSNYHDAAITVIDDNGDILFAGHSERYSKVKHDPVLHPDLIDEALDYTGRLPGSYEIHYYERPLLKLLRQWRSGEGFFRNLKNIYARHYLGGDSNHRALTRPVLPPESRLYAEDYRDHAIFTHSHHLSHAAAGFQTSPYDDATVLVVDAIGEFETVTIWQAHYDDNGRARYKKRWSQTYPDSIGLFYTAMTKRVGLKPLDEEYILMGMAAYGTNGATDQMHRDLIDDESSVTFKQNLHTGVDGDYLSEHSSEDIAHATQTNTELILRQLLLRCQRRGISKNLVYAGGVALNCLANRILGEYFERVWIMPNPGDAGSSLGAAALGYGRRLNWTNAFLGHNIHGNYPVNELIKVLLVERIVGVASGRAEFGPRALGNRSLLADPRGVDIKKLVNDIKCRQQFRPFAPVILEEHVNDYFVLPPGWTRSPYMQTVAVCRHPELYPAIIHVDGTSRVQTVGSDGSGIRKLLKAWYRKTGCPMLLNTSLNIRGEPMVNDRADADRFESLHNIKVVS